MKFLSPHFNNCVVGSGSNKSERVLGSRERGANLRERERGRFEREVSKGDRESNHIKFEEIFVMIYLYINFDS